MENKTQKNLIAVDNPDDLIEIIDILNNYENIHSNKEDRQGIIEEFEDFFKES